MTTYHRHRLCQTHVPGCRAGSAQGSLWDSPDPTEDRKPLKGCPHLHPTTRGQQGRGLG